MKKKDFIYCLVIIALLVLVFSRPSVRERVTVQTQIDTVTVREYITILEPEPYAVHHYHTDTVTMFVYLPADVEGAKTAYRWRCLFLSRRKNTGARTTPLLSGDTARNWCGSTSFRRAG